MASLEPTSIAIRTGTATLRSVRPEDAGELVALRVAVASETEFLMGGPTEIRTDIERQAAFLATKVASTVDLYILAEVDGRIVGIANLEGSSLVRFAHGATLALAVSREYWGHGIGRALMLALLRWADARGLVRVALEVVETNTRAIRLYEALGFEHEGRLRCCRKHGAVYLNNLQMARIRPPPAPA